MKSKPLPLSILLLLLLVGVNCTNDSVCKKITSLEAQYRKAKDWLENTGSGVEDEEQLRTVVLKMCPYFYDLDAVMKDRPSSYAAYTNEILFLIVV